MKKTVARIAAIALSLVMMLSLCGCDELLEYALQDYMQTYMEQGGGSYDFTGSGYDYTGGDYTGGGYGTTGGVTNNGTAMVTGDVLTQAVREQFTKMRGNGQDVVTVMVYMCASNLESESGLASEDIKEMMRATSNSNLNIVIETGGAKKWYTNGISSTVNQRHIIQNGKLRTVDSGRNRRIMTESASLSDFINFCSENFPADRYMLILWDHGGGPVEGYGYDEYGGYDTMTIDELGRALYDTHIKFDFIGFDACLMSALEVACVLYDFADYMIASEDYEGGYGWEYQRWLSALANDTSTPTTELAPMICDDFITESGKENAILACYDLSYMKIIYTAWRDFAYAAQDQLLDENFSWQTESSGSRISLNDLNSLFSSTSQIQDMAAIANAVKDVPEAEAVVSSLGRATVYCTANKGDSHMTGMSVALPYGDSSTYREIKTIFTNAGFEKEYIDFLGKFTSVSQGNDLYDWSNWYSNWMGWDDDHDYGSDYSWGNWNGWDEYNSDDYGWSIYDYYDYIFGNGNGSSSNNGYNGYNNGGTNGYNNGYGSDDYGYGDLFDFFNYGGYDDYSDYGYYSNGGNGGYGGYGNGGYGGYGDGYGGGYDDGGWGDLFDYFFGQ